MSLEANKKEFLCHLINRNIGPNDGDGPFSHRQIEDIVNKRTLAISLSKPASVLIKRYEEDQIKHYRLETVDCIIRSLLGYSK